MPDAHKNFLLSFERGEPDWSLIGLPEAANLPDIKWRQLNLNKLPADKPSAQVSKMAFTATGEV